MPQKKIAVIQDMSGYGRCSMTVALPLISSYGIQCCPVPTSLFSNHTGYSSYYFFDFTEQMPAYIEEWKKKKLHFDAIYVGFLGSARQIDIVADFISFFRAEDTRVLIDPVMGDHGKLYATYTPEMCRRMREFLGLADVITPNLTEACILAEVPYRDSGWTRKELEALSARCEALLSGGEKKSGDLVITGIPAGSMLGNFLRTREGETRFLHSRIAGHSRPGTGDVFASVLAAELTRGSEFPKAVKKAAAFVRKCIIRSDEEGIPIQDGVCFEELL